MKIKIFVKFRLCADLNIAPIDRPLEKEWLRAMAVRNTVVKRTAVKRMAVKRTTLKCTALKRTALKRTDLNHFFPKGITK